MNALERSQVDHVVVVLEGRDDDAGRASAKPLASARGVFGRIGMCHGGERPRICIEQTVKATVRHSSRVVHDTRREHAQEGEEHAGARGSDGQGVERRERRPYRPPAREIL